MVRYPAIDVNDESFGGPLPIEASITARIVDGEFESKPYGRGRRLTLLVVYDRPRAVLSGIVIDDADKLVSGTGLDYSHEMSGKRIRTHHMGFSEEHAKKEGPLVAIEFI